MPWVLTPLPAKIKAIFTDTDNTTFTYIWPVPSYAAEAVAFARAAAKARTAWKARKTAANTAIVKLSAGMSTAGETATIGTDLSGQNETETAG